MVAAWPGSERKVDSPRRVRFGIALFIARTLISLCHECPWCAAPAPEHAVAAVSVQTSQRQRAPAQILNIDPTVEVTPPSRTGSETVSDALVCPARLSGITPLLLPGRASINGFALEYRCLADETSTLPNPYVTEWPGIQQQPIDEPSLAINSASRFRPLGAGSKAIPGRPAGGEASPWLGTHD